MTLATNHKPLVTHFMPDIATLKDEALTAINDAGSLDALESIRVGFLGKKGKLTEQLKQLGQATPEERKTLGQALNQLKQELAENLEQKKERLAKEALNDQLEQETVDISLPVRPEQQGAIHPITHVMDEIIAIFTSMGFQVGYGPDIEDDFHNFTALNIPPEHPARQMHDTFYLKTKEGEEPPVLRTHTSPVQIRTMMDQQPPIRVIAPGSTYRCDSDATHTPMFHQVEGLVIGKDIHMGHLKGCLIEFVETFFNVSNVPVRFRNSFFPFTEPSAEVDIGCAKRKGELVIGEGDDWLEILGCGMVNPNVLRNCNIDPDEWQGFAFGMGVERLAMLKYGMADLRQFYECDLRWLRHYGFSAFHHPSITGGLSG